MTDAAAGRRSAPDEPTGNRKNEEHGLSCGPSAAPFLSISSPSGRCRRAIRWRWCCWCSSPPPSAQLDLPFPGQRFGRRHRPGRLGWTWVSAVPSRSVPTSSPRSGILAAVVMFDVAARFALTGIYKFVGTGWEHASGWWGGRPARRRPVRRLRRHHRQRPRVPETINEPAEPSIDDSPLLGLAPVGRAAHPQCCGAGQALMHGVLRDH